MSTDHQLMLAVRDGDVKKLGLLFERYHKQLYNFFLKLTGNRQICEDLVQEVFLRMLKYRHTYRAEGKFTTWMFQIARNARIDYFRQHHHRENQVEETDQFLCNEPNPEEILEQKSNVALLQKAIAKLSSKNREVIVLSRFHNKRYQEIAKILGYKEGSIKSLMFRALKELTEIYFDLAGEKKP